MQKKSTEEEEEQKQWHHRKPDADWEVLEGPTCNIRGDLLPLNRIREKGFLQVTKLNSISIR